MNELSADFPHILGKNIGAGSTGVDAPVLITQY